VAQCVLAHRWFDCIAGGALGVPECELFPDRWTEHGCRQVGADFRAGSRFTVKSDAIIGVVVKKIGHDDRMQEYLEGIRF